MHADVAEWMLNGRRLGPGYQVHSAGFISPVTMECHGRSESLGVYSDPEDTDRIRLRRRVIPAVLIPPAPFSAISTRRALKQIKELLEGIPETTPEMEDRILASLDDIDVMIRCISDE